MISFIAFVTLIFIITIRLTILMRLFKKQVKELVEENPNILQETNLTLSYFFAWLPANGAEKKLRLEAMLHEGVYCYKDQISSAKSLVFWLIGLSCVPVINILLLTVVLIYIGILTIGKILDKIKSKFKYNGINNIRIKV